MRKFLSVAFLWFQSTLAYGAPIYGDDYLAACLPKFGIEKAVKYPRNAYGVLDYTFGPDLTPFKLLLRATHPRYARTHLINGTCITNQNCGSYEIGYGYTNATFDRAVRNKNEKILRYVRNRTGLYKALSQEVLGTTLLISPVLEHHLSREAYRVLADEVLKSWPEAQLVNVPGGGTQVERYRGAWIERHGNQPQRDADIVSLDGADATQIDINAFKARLATLPNLKIVLGWTASYNARIGMWVDPRRRTWVPKESTFELMAHIFDDRPKTPVFSGKQCKTMLAFKEPSIWKPLAEQGPKADPREQLPVMITKGFGGKPILVIAANGETVGTLGFYANYLDQGNRYYSGYHGGSNDGGYELERNAIVAADSSWVWLRQGDVCKGPLVPGMRQGLMRDK